ncbi:MAG: hypothetical protein HQP61_04955 [Peptococcaceae bacterium]|nr:hypothetical protein [Candidatus Syntrophopropionicum ammoniitolerans]
MSSYKIIKAAQVQENPFQVLPLSNHKTLELQEYIKCADDSTAEATPDQASEDQLQAEEIVNLAHTRADEIIKMARHKEQEIIDKAQSRGEQIKQEAYQNAFDKGHKKGSEAGYQDGLAQANEEAIAIRLQAEEVLAQAEKIRRQTLETMEQEIVELAREIAEKLVSQQLALAPEMVIQIAEESLRLVADRLQVVLYINPQEMELVESRRDHLASLLPERAQLQCIADGEIQPGGCWVETEQGRVDATMKTRWDELVRALYGPGSDIKTT